MKKFLLVLLVGEVLALNLYGIVKLFTADVVEEIDHVKGTTMTVYVE